ncbi:MAG TPA: caspase family protein [Longimicrobiales bacterium]|nr:caspase family protein [Longimicrobiales bacterium]
MRTRKFAALAATLLLVAFAPHTSNAPNRWALIVGISDYASFGDEIGGDLPGASWDARRMRDVLMARWGFAEDRIHMVLDLDATRQRLETELTDWLPSVARQGDIVVFYFAGHGSQTWDLDGDEEDGLDETICPTDVLKGDASKDITDDELGAWLSRIPADVTVILDNCHAGTGTRAVTPFARPRSLARDATTDLEKPAIPARAGRTAEAPAPRNVLEIAAAQAGEVAVDAEWPGTNGAPATHGGAFTTNFVRNLWRVPRRTSYEDVFHLTAEDMKRQRFAQQPLLTKNGAEARPFGFTSADQAGTDDAFVPVAAVTGNAVRLGGGAGAGMTVGSIYRSGAALLRVREVLADAATATVEQGAAPRRGAAAQLVAYAYPEAALRVSLADVDQATRSAVTSAAGSASALQFVTNARDFAHLIVRPAERGYVIIGMDGAIRHAVSGTDRAANTRLVAEKLQHEAAAHQLAALDNPGQSQTLEFSFGDERTSFRMGERISFAARAPRNGYLTIIDIGTDGKVVVLFPLESARDNRVTAGQTIRLPAEAGSFYEAQQPAGRGIVRAFLTDRPLDLPFREGEAEQAPRVLAALRVAAGSPPVAGTAIPTGTWLTTAVVYTIEP